MTKRQSQSLPPTVPQLHVRYVMDGLSFRVSVSGSLGKLLAMTILVHRLVCG